MKYPNIREEELKNRVAQDCFWLFDCTKIVGNIDFCVSIHQSANNQAEQQSLLWAEAKRGASDIYKSLVQLILTIGKARTFDKYLPPALLAAFDSEKIAFIPYNDIQEVFYQNDFNWNVPPSNHETKEFKLVYDKVKTALSDRHYGLDPQSPNSENSDFCRNDDVLIFYYERDEHELKQFIKHNFADGKFGLTKIKIDKNNFITIYNKWFETVKPTIAINWEIAKKNKILDGDFYLADLLSANNETIKDKLSVLLKTSCYETNRHFDETGMFASSKAEFLDKQKAHTQFWAKYERPPKEEYWDYIVNRRDLLMPQDVRERKGSFFTPKIWVEKSQEYIAAVLGEDWQDEYYVWDCCAGTGNLLAGLTNKYNIWASTLDQQDVDVMKDRIENGANLLESHVFQFDFLNDDFSKLPQGLQDIIHDEEKRKKLVIYINPPYAEASNRKTIVLKGENRSNVATETKMYKNFSPIVGTATRELFAQFFLRIYKEISDCKLASFSTLKYVSSQYFIQFRNYFKMKFEKGFVCKANSFDNVNGDFPIGFSVLNLAAKKEISKIEVDVYDNNREVTQSCFIGRKIFYSYKAGNFIINWLRKYYDKDNEHIAHLRMQGTDIQNNLGVFITNNLSKNDILKHLYTTITKKNLIEISIYFAVRKVIPATWLNDRDQFLYPSDGWKNDTEFQNDCLCYALFNNNIQSKYGTNHWIPFTEDQISARDKFSSHFMTDFIAGKKTNFSGGGGGAKQMNMFMVFEPQAEYGIKRREFSPEAQTVFEAGRELWQYYHAIAGKAVAHTEVQYNVNASLYDIKEYFQGRNNKGKMNNKSEDEKYNELIDNLRSALKILAKKIEPKVYEYEFLKR